MGSWCEIDLDIRGGLGVKSLSQPPVQVLTDDLQQLDPKEAQ